MKALVRPEHSNDFTVPSIMCLSPRFRRIRRRDSSTDCVNINDCGYRLIAQLDGVIVGHIAFSEVTIAGSVASPAGVGLAPLAIRPELQRRGLGIQLINKGLCACTRLGAGYVVVLGTPEYYHRFGFRSADLFGLQNEYGAGDAFMALELKTGSITPGLVGYAPEFSDLTSGHETA